MRLRSRRIRHQGKEDLNYVDKILNDNMSIESLKYDKQFWKLITTNQEFRKTIIEAMVTYNAGENIPAFFSMVFVKTVEKELTNDFHQMIYFEERFFHIFQ